MGQVYILNGTTGSMIFKKIFMVVLLQILFAFPFWFQKTEVKSIVYIKEPLMKSHVLYAMKDAQTQIANHQRFLQ